MFWQNVKRRLTAVAILLRQAEIKGISNTAKSSYYRAATILLCSVIEGMVYQLVKKHTNKAGNIIDKSYDHKQIHKIPNKVFGMGNEICICEKLIKNVHIDDSGVQFGKLNLYLKNNKIINQREYRILDKVRNERNKIHLQGLKFTDTGYTKDKVKGISKPTDFLTNKLT